MKILKENANSMVLCLAEAIVGTLLLVNPAAFTTSIIMFAGIALMVIGLIDAVKYFQTEAAEATASQQLARGLIALLAGAFCAFNSQWFIATFPVITIIYGVAILVAGLGKVQLAVDMFRLKNAKWFWGAISAAISIICAVIILLNPFASTMVLWLFTGITLVVEAVFDIATLVISSRAKEGPSV